MLQNDNQATPKGRFEDATTFRKFGENEQNGLMELKEKTEQSIDTIENEKKHNNTDYSNEVTVESTAIDLTKNSHETSEASLEKAPENETIHTENKQDEKDSNNNEKPAVEAKERPKKKILYSHLRTCK